MKHFKVLAVFMFLAAIVVGGVHYARTHAAGNGTIYINPASGNYSTGSTITLNVRENSGSSAVNAASITASYNQSLLQYQSWDFGGSAFEIAAASSGGGGNINTDRGTTNQSLTGDQLVGKVIFKVLAPGSVTINIAGSSVVLQTSDNTNQVTTRTGAIFNLQSGFENRVAHRPDGRAYYFSGDKRYSIPNPTVRNCIMVRNSTGADFLTSNAEVDAFTDAGVPAHCPYEKEPGLNFLKENDAPTIWLVHADGTKQHVGSLCVSDPFTTVLKKFHVFTVPASELAGHIVGTDWFASGSACAALPG